MAARYIHPGRRNTGKACGQRPINAANETSSGAPEPSSGFSPKSYLAGDIYNHFDSGKETPRYNISTTLHASASSPNSLAFVLLFPGANPRWATDRILFVKSHLNLIRTGTEDNKAGSSARELPHSVAVFERTRRSQLAKFAFTGWYKVTHVQFISPHTADLVRMLEQKWTKRDRDGNVSQIEREGDAWIRSLNQHWAVVKFEKDEGAEKEKGNFEIPEKSVNELLQEMRFRGSVAGDVRDTMTSKGSQDITAVTEQHPNVSSDNTPASATKEGTATEAVGGRQGLSNTEDATGSL